MERLLSLVYVYPFRCQLCGHRFRFLQWGVKYQRVPEDRRRYERLLTRFPVTFAGENAKGAGVVFDISVKGCSFEAEAQLQVGSVVRMALEIPKEPRPVHVDAAVVRNVRQENVGVEFLRFQKSERDRLQHFIHELSYNQRP
jgi:hypothetical protein